MKFWRSKGTCVIIVCIDDGIGVLKSKVQNLVHGDIAVSDLKLVRFVLHIPKSCLEPQQIGQWLGFILDLLKGNFYVPDDGLTSLKSVVGNVYPLHEFLLSVWPRLL